MLNDNNLTVVDKCFMICNPTLFKPRTRNDINFKREEYYKATMASIGKKVLLAMETEKSVVFGKVDDILKNIESKGIKDNITMFIDKIKDMPCESKEDIVVILKEWGLFVDSITSFYLDPLTVAPTSDNIDTIVHRMSIYFFITIMGYMLKAHTIMRTMKLKLDGFIELDINTYRYISNIPGSIIHELFFMNDDIKNVPQFCATNIYILIKYLDIKEDVKFNYDSIFSKPLELITKSESLRNKINDLVDKLLSKEIDVISCIETLPKELYFNILKSDEYNDEKIIENFDKTNICDKLNNGDMIVGSNIFSDKGIKLVEIGIEINRLHPGHIKSILSSKLDKPSLDKLEISYTLSSQELGALIASEYKTCKYFSNKTNSFYNLVEKDGEVLLLFKDNNTPNDFFGISLFEDYDKKERTLVKFDIDRNIEYALEYAE